MSPRFLGWSAAILAALIALALVVGELIDAGLRRWWSARPLTADTVSGLLVLSRAWVSTRAEPAGAALNRQGVCR